MVRWLLGNSLRMRWCLLAATVLLTAVLVYCEFRSQTPLHFAAWGGDLSDVQVLVEEGADMEATTTWGFTALHAAARRGHLEVVKYLVGAGADMEATDNWGWGSTPLHWAAEKGHFEIVQFLVGAGADVNATNKWGGTARDWAEGEGLWAIAEYLESVGG